MWPVKRNDRLPALAELAKLQSDAGLARLAAAEMHLRRIRARMDGLDVALSDAVSSPQADAAALLNFETYLRWACSERLALESEALHASDARDACRCDATVAFGRHRVLLGLSTRTRG